MNKRILILSITVLTSVIMTLPMISITQAKPGGIPTEMYRDLYVIGNIVPDGSPDPADVLVRGNIQSAIYTAHCVAPSFMSNAGQPWIGIFWDGEIGTWNEHRYGTATYDFEYKINTNTMRGVVHLETVVTLGAMTPTDTDDGTFEGAMFWEGELQWRTDYPNTVRLVNTGMWHTVWQGTGAYEGWKVIQNMNANPPGADVMTGTAEDSHMIKPIDE